MKLLSTLPQLKLLWGITCGFEVLTILALFTFTLCNAQQLKTQSNYDVNGDGKVTIEDVTATVNKVLGKVSDDRTLVDGESLNALLLSIMSRLEALEKSTTPADPYNGHEYVDLGLPSGLKWATCNVGANAPEEFGDYFAWGDTKPYYKEGHSQDHPCKDWISEDKNTYNWSSYKWCLGTDNTLTKYGIHSANGIVDYKAVLDPEDDAAHVNWRGDWRMPTKGELDELKTKCSWTWEQQNGVDGYKVVGPNGNSIFLPAARERVYIGFSGQGSGRYWSSTLCFSYSSSEGGWGLDFKSDGIEPKFFYRYEGHTIRPVCP